MAQVLSSTTKSCEHQKFQKWLQVKCTLKISKNAIIIDIDVGYICYYHEYHNKVMFLFVFWGLKVQVKIKNCYQYKK